MATREKKKLIMEVSRENAEEAFAQYNTCYSQLEIQQGKMNAELTAIKEKYENKIKDLQEKRDEHFEMLQAFAESSPDLFSTKKSLEFTHGTIGFRTGTPKLTCLKGYKWPAVFDLLKKKQWTDFIRVKEEVDKESLLAGRAELPLADVGLEVVQDETFFVQPALEVVTG